MTALLFAAMLAACPQSFSELPREGELFACRDGERELRAVATGRGAARWVVLRRLDHRPHRLGGQVERSVALVSPDGVLREGVDLASALASGELKPATDEERARLVGLSLLGTYERVWGPAKLPHDEPLRAHAHLPPPSIERLAGGLVRLTFYGEQLTVGPGADRRRTIDQLRLTLVPAGPGVRIEPELGRIFEEGTSGGVAFSGWRPDRAPPPR